MAKSIGDLNIKLGVDGSKLTAGFAQAGKAVQGFGTQVSKVAGGVSRLFAGGFAVGTAIKVLQSVHAQMKAITEATVEANLKAKGFGAQLAALNGGYLDGPRSAIENMGDSIFGSDVIDFLSGGERLQAAQERQVQDKINQQKTSALAGFDKFADKLRDFNRESLSNKNESLKPILDAAFDQEDLISDIEKFKKKLSSAGLNANMFDAQLDELAAAGAARIGEGFKDAAANMADLLGKTVMTDAVRGGTKEAFQAEREHAAKGQAEGIINQLVKNLQAQVQANQHLAGIKALLQPQPGGDF